ncbi:MAG: hypothetical protein AAF353_13700 [Pseudomonadota bacterium]
MNQKQALIKAIDITDEILAILDSGTFDGVENLEIERQPLIRQAFSASLEEIDMIKAKHLEKLNEQVVSKLTLFKKSVRAQQVSVQKAARATRAYQEQIETF